MPNYDKGKSPVSVLIIGAGPVGLLLANLLGRQQVPVLVAEQRTNFPEWSRAIGITPPSLEILRSGGLHDVVEKRGVRVQEAHVHDDRGCAGKVSFADIDSEFRHILTLPQCATMKILADNLTRFPSVRVCYGQRLISLRRTEEYVLAEFESPNPNGNPQVQARWVVGCDGADSSVRGLAGSSFKRRPYAPRFLMADYDDHTDLGTQAHLYFKHDGSVESFPLPDKQRRWVALANDLTTRDDCTQLLEKHVVARTGYSLTDSTRRSPVFEFIPERVDLKRIAFKHILLAGDAAHVMSPIGGQGMNTGFADAELAATILPRLLDGEDPEPLLAAYDTCRRRAAAVARRRAAFGMWVGTRTGRFPASIRNLALRTLMASPAAAHIAPYFAMLTIPYNRAAKATISPSAKRSRVQGGRETFSRRG